MMWFSRFHRLHLLGIACLLTVVAPGCDDDGGPGRADPATVAGAYGLLTLDGAELPGQVEWHGITLSLVADTVELREDGSFEWTSLDTDDVRLGLIGSFQLREDQSLILYESVLGAEVAGGVIKDDTLTLQTSNTHPFGIHTWKYVSAR